ncbi:VAC8 [Symbiodinium sp. CCMP2592]|nr:VAC8 [Symbiodinium sp. CCMP2592]
MAKRHRDGPGLEDLQDERVIRICASCPSEEYNRAEGICSELHITTTFGRKGDFMEDTDGQGWFGKWQNRVLQSMDVLLQKFKNTEETVDIQLVLIMDGKSDNCRNERDKINDLEESLKHHYQNSALTFDVHHKQLYIEDLMKEIRKKPTEESVVQAAYQKFLDGDLSESFHVRAWSFHLKALALEAQVSSPGPSAKLLIDHGDLVGSALNGESKDRLSGCDHLKERVDRLLSCCAVSKRIGPIINRWKIPIRFDPQSLLVAWALDQRVDLESEEELARCLPEIAEHKGREIGLTEWNQEGKTRLAIFKRWYRVPDIQDASQKERELQEILTEAKKAGLSLDLLERIQKKQDGWRDGNVDEESELHPEEMLYLMPKGPPANGLPTRVSFEGRIVPGARVCWISFPARYAPCWDALTGESATDSVACIFQAEEDGHEKDGCGEGDPGWQSKWLARVQEAVDNGQRLKVALPPGRVDATQAMELAKAKEMGWSYEEVDVCDVLEEQFARGHLVDAWCEATRSWRRGTVEKQDVLDVEQEDGSEDAVVRWTLRCQITKQQTFDSPCVCSTAATMQALLDHVGDAKLRGILMECLPHVDVLDIGTHRLRPDLVALRAKLQIKSIGTLQKLRDRVLNDELEVEINQKLADPRWEVAVSKSQFLQVYDSSLRALDKLTRHQRERLNAIKCLERVHLSAPAGAGKTFVAVERVVDELTPAADEPAPRVLYVSATVELVCYFVQWLAVRLRSQRKDLGLLSGLLVLFKPYKQLLQLRMPAVQEGRIEFEAANINHDKNDKFDLLVIDECHNMYQDGVDRGIIDDLHCSRKLLLSDRAQSSAVTATFPDMEKVQLTEVVRSTRQIVLGAASFQVNAEAAVPAGTDGPPVKSFIFEASKDEAERMKHYARRVMQAIVHVENVYSGVRLHRRLAIFVPDDQFLRKLKKALSPLLRDGLPDRKFRFVKQGESLRSLPQWLRSTGIQRVAGEQEERGQEDIILDTVDVVDGLEHLIVICVGLDAPIQGEARDLVTRADLYKGLTRAQLLAVVVNEEVEDGWFAFLSNVRYESSRQLLEEASKHRSQAAAKVWQVAADSPQKPAQKNDAASEKLHQQKPPPSQSERTWNTKKSPQVSKKVPQQVSSIWDTRSNEVSGLKKPAFDPLRAAKVQAQADQFKEDIETLQRNDTEAQLQAAVKLRDLAADDDNRVFIAAAGGIPALVDLLTSSTPDAQRHAASALWNLAVDDDNKISIAEAGAIPPLVALLTHGTMNAQKNATGALSELVVEADNKSSIAVAGAIPPLVELLSSSNPEVQAAAASTLYELAEDDNNKSAIAEAGGIPQLLNLLNNPSVQDEATLALAQLATHEDGHALIAQAGGIPPLVQLLTASTTAVQATAATTIGNLMTAGVITETDIVFVPGAVPKAQANRVGFAAAGAIPPLIRLLNQKETAASAAHALRELAADNEDNQVAVAEAGGIPPLVRLLLSSDGADQQRSAGALGNLADNADNMAAIVAAGAVPHLVTLMSGDNQKAQERAPGVLLKLCAHPQGLSEAKASGALGAAAELEVSGTPAAQEAAKRLVELLRPGR